MRAEYRHLLSKSESSSFVIVRSSSLSSPTPMILPIQNSQAMNASVGNFPSYSAVGKKYSSRTFRDWYERDANHAVLNDIGEAASFQAAHRISDRVYGTDVITLNEERSMALRK